MSEQQTEKPQSIDDRIQEAIIEMLGSEGNLTPNSSITEINIPSSNPNDRAGLKLFPKESGEDNQPILRKPWGREDQTMIIELPNLSNIEIKKTAPESEDSSGSEHISDERKEQIKKFILKQSKVRNNLSITRDNKGRLSIQRAQKNGTTVSLSLTNPGEIASLRKLLNETEDAQNLLEQLNRQELEDSKLPTDLSTLKQLLQNIQDKAQQDTSNLQLRIRIEDKNGEIARRYQISFQYKGKDYLVAIDPKSGKIKISIKQQDGDDYQLVAFRQDLDKLPKELLEILGGEGKINLPEEENILKVQQDDYEQAKSKLENYLSLRYPDFQNKSPKDKLATIKEFFERYLNTKNLSNEEKAKLLQELYQQAGLIVEGNETFDERATNIEKAKQAIELASRQPTLSPDQTREPMIMEFAKIFLADISEEDLNNLIEEAKKEIRKEQTAKVNGAINHLYYKALSKNLQTESEIRRYISDELKAPSNNTLSPQDMYLLTEPLDEYIQRLIVPSTRSNYLKNRFLALPIELITTSTDADQKAYMRLKLQELRQQLREEGFRDSEIEYLIKSGQITFTAPDLQNQLLIEFSLKSPEEMPEGSILTPTQIAKLAEDQENDAATAEMRDIDLQIAERELKNKVPSKLSHLKKQWNVFWKRIIGPGAIFGASYLIPIALFTLGGTIVGYNLTSGGLLGLFGVGLGSTVGLVAGGALGYGIHQLAKGKMREAEIEVLKAQKKAKEIKFRRQQQESVEKLWERLEKYFRSTEPTVDKNTARILKILGISDRKTETIRSAKEKLMRYYETMQDQAQYILNVANNNNIHLATAI